MNDPTLDGSQIVSRSAVHKPCNFVACEKFLPPPCLKVTFFVIFHPSPIPSRRRCRARGIAGQIARTATVDEDTATGCHVISCACRRAREGIADPFHVTRARGLRERAQRGRARDGDRISRDIEISERDRHRMGRRVSGNRIVRRAQDFPAPSAFM